MRKGRQKYEQKEKHMYRAAMSNNSLCFDFDWDDVQKQNGEGVNGSQFDIARLLLKRR